MKNWKKEFDKKWEYIMQHSDDDDDKYANSLPAKVIKRFVTTLLNKQRKELISIIENEMDKPLTQGEWKVLDNILNKLN